VAGIQPDLPLSPLQGESARSVALRMMMILIADLGGYRFESH
jgi:hypothetical protein